MYLTKKTEKMNCKECQNNLSNYLEGNLSDDAYLQIKMHLRDCRECSESYSILKVTEEVIHKEKRITSNPFLSTRIMTEIEKLENKEKVTVYKKALQPILIAASISIAIVFGVFAGNMYQPSKIQRTVPVELVYINDAGLESLAVYENQ